MNVGPYEILDEIGRGGMGAVYRARASSGAVVAVKLLLGAGPDRIARFERERRLLGDLAAADGFVPLLDSGTSPKGLWFAMPFADGGTLRDRLARGPLGIDETVELGRALAVTLARAHARGIVHRDVKPENVLFHEGRPLLADLGLAKHFDDAAPGASRSVVLSKQGELKGTAGYIAPEQMEDAASAGPAADVYALGTILYECLAGALPFTGDNLIELLTNAAEGKREPLARRRPDVPRWLGRVVDRALAPRPEDRYRDGAALRDALSPERRSRPRAPLIVAALLLLAVPVGVWIGHQPTTSDAPARAPLAEPTPVAVRGPREGPLVRLQDGTEVRVYLYALPAGAGDMELVKVPAGDFLMGMDDGDTDERPRHAHRIPSAYYIGRTPVTWKQYLAFCSATGRAAPRLPDFATRSDHPAVDILHSDAENFCEWARLSLPSEAEWEKAARGTDGRVYPWGNVWEPGGARCNYLDKSCPLDALKTEHDRSIWWDRDYSDGFPFTSPVGSFPGGASPYGALDMAGNVRQWCDERYDKFAYERYVTGDDTLPRLGYDQVTRGGSWLDHSFNCRSAYRAKDLSDKRRDNVGFRVVLR